MAFENPVLTLSRPAGADLSSSQLLFVKSSSGNAVLAGNNEQALGVLQNDPTATGTASIMVLGVSRVIASAAIAEGAQVGSNAAGKAKTAATGSVILGIALEAAAADGDVIPLLLHAGTALHA
jgi:hypothetical protein